MRRTSNGGLTKGDPPVLARSGFKEAVKISWSFFQAMTIPYRDSKRVIVALKAIFHFTSTHFRRQQRRAP